MEPKLILFVMAADAVIDLSAPWYMELLKAGCLGALVVYLLWERRQDKKEWRETQDKRDKENLDRENSMVRRIQTLEDDLREK